MKKSQVDPDKWRKKFWYMMDREKIFCFDQQETSQQFSKKGIMTSLEPKLVKKALGEEILKDSAHFWILFVKYNKDKFNTGDASIDIDQKEKIRRQLVDNFFEYNQRPRSWTEKVQEKQEMLKKYLDDQLYLPDRITKHTMPRMLSNTPSHLHIKTEGSEIVSGREKESYSPCKNFEMEIQSHIDPTLQEIQQEEEIIFINETRRDKNDFTAGFLTQNTIDQGRNAEENQTFTNVTNLITFRKCESI